MNGAVLLFGANGFIGSAILSHMKENGYRVHGFDIGSESVSSELCDSYCSVLSYSYTQHLKDIVAKETLGDIYAIFANSYCEETIRRAPCFNIPTNATTQERKDFIDAWVRSSSDHFAYAIEKQIGFIDLTLKKIITTIDQAEKLHIIFFGSAFSEHNQLLKYFSKLDSIVFKHPAYYLTKKALLSYQRFLVDLFYGKGIQVNSILPGVLERGQADRFANSIRRATAFQNKLVTLNEVLMLTAFLASPKSSGIHGQAIVIDNGWIS
jgi:NAD(P)-dependent dehydrogenase (short-subunit alcohol dehydrogenase family)